MKIISYKFKSEIRFVHTSNQDHCDFLTEFDLFEKKKESQTSNTDKKHNVFHFKKAVSKSLKP